MIQANELRIGNLVRVENEVLNVNFLNENDIGLEGDISRSGLYHRSFVSSLEITEEWLLKFGFARRSDNHYSISQKNISFIWSPELWLYCIDNNSGYSIPLDHIRYVHQLQNLYFALTGEELKLKS